ncbi:MAG: hypothetical protein LGB53_01580 [Sulfurovum sp.]|nr:hypothetical protein [Sulfurovum sp.]
MKFTKLSLVAILAVSAAFAADNGKVSGDARLYYGTTTDDTASPKQDLFGKANSIGDVAARVDYTRSLMGGALTLNTGLQGLSTLGLESELVGGTWVGHGAGAVQDAYWIDTFNAQIQLRKNVTVTIGRQALDTPFFFTETWSIAKNTFDAVVATNSDLPKTTLVAAWVGRGNGSPGNGKVVQVNNTDINGGMHTFGGKPAYAFAAVTKLIPNTVTQAWYYKVPGAATAYWAQADSNVAGVDLGVQYAGTELTASGDKTSGFAVKLGYGKGAWSAYGAYSATADDATGIDISNIATGLTGASQSKLYTESYWNYGYVGARNAKSFAVGGEYNLSSVKLGAQYTNVTGDNSSMDLKEATVTASTKLSSVNVDLAYINAEKGSRKENTVLVMAKLPFNL